jgi:YfiH family protein
VIKNYESTDIRHIKNGNVEYLQFKILDKYSDKVKHCITLRHGGMSGEYYSSLNFRILGNDLKDNVFKNLDIISDVVGFTNIFKGKQDHTDNILVINDSNKDKYLFSLESDEKVDGYICNDKNIATLITTADCNPIIIYDTKNNIIANIHSGWKGTVKQIYLKGIKQMNELFGTKNEDIIVCVGPSINKCCFTSEDKEFIKNFSNIWKNENEYISYDLENRSRFHIDLHYLIKKDLQIIKCLEHKRLMQKEIK